MSDEVICSVVAVFAIALIVPGLMLLTRVLGPRAQNRAKNEPYESGIQTMIGSVNQRFSVKFYLVAILFLIFDIEAVFMYPWAVCLRDLGWFGYVEMLVFMVLLFAGLFYIIQKKVLLWR